jgi:glycosidase
VLWYGQEIGMGDNPDVQGRLSVRTPMQWSSRPGAGFSTAPADRIVRPLVNDGPFGFDKVNVADQRRDKESLLNWTERGLRLRRECPELGWGEAESLDVGDDAVLALQFRWEDRHMLTLHNLSDRDTQVELPDFDDEEMGEVLVAADDDPWEQGSTTVRLGPYSFRWLQGGTTFGLPPGA